MTTTEETYREGTGLSRRRRLPGSNHPCVDLSIWKEFNGAHEASKIHVNGPSDGVTTAFAIPCSRVSTRSWRAEDRTMACAGLQPPSCGPVNMERVQRGPWSK